MKLRGSCGQPLCFHLCAQILQYGARRPLCAESIASLRHRQQDRCCRSPCSHNRIRIWRHVVCSTKTYVHQGTLPVDLVGSPRARAQDCHLKRPPALWELQGARLARKVTVPYLSVSADGIKCDARETLAASLSALATVSPSDEEQAEPSCGQGVWFLSSRLPF